MTKKTLSTGKRQLTEWKRTSEPISLSNRLIHRLYKWHKKLNNHKTKNPGEKQAKKSNSQFSKDGIQMASNTGSLAIRERQIRTTMRFPLTLIIMAIAQNFKKLEMMVRTHSKAYNNTLITKILNESRSSKTGYCLKMHFMYRQ